MDQAHFQAVAGLAHSDQTAAHARHVAVVVRAEYVDQRVETADAFVEVIGDIRCEVSAYAVLALHDPVFIVAKGGGAKPQRAVFLIQMSSRAQPLERPIDGAAGDELALRRPAVKLDAKRREVVAYVGQHRIEADAQHLLEALHA